MKKTSLRSLGMLAVSTVLLATLGCRSESKDTPSTVEAPPVTPSYPPGEAPCPAKLSELAGLAEPGEKTCVCPPGPASGKVWGSGIYTLESSACAAAIHAGALTPEGGKIAVRLAPGCPAYLGSTNNKVSTFPAESKSRSFYFPSVSDGKCGPAPVSE